MTEWVGRLSRRFWAGGLAVAVLASVLVLARLGYQAMAEWQRSAALLAQRRADGAVDLLVTAITRDMRGAQTSVLSSLRFNDLTPTATLDLNRVASAFARYPYPEVFFASMGSPVPGPLAFYSRVERSPAWFPKGSEQPRFPVIIGSEPQLSQELLDRIGHDVEGSHRFSTFDHTIHGVDYQVVALVTYADPVRERVKAIFGFMVSYDWVRKHYFQELAAQVAHIQGVESGLALSIVDADGTAVVGERPVPTNENPSSTLQFPLLFFDPAVVVLNPPADLKRDSWTAGARISRDPALTAARLGARRTMIIAAVSALVLAAGFVLTVRATRASARLAAMRSDFVSAVTHELKTPIATIRAISETLASGRRSGPEMSREYARLAVQESKRLTRLIDNLLAYARITDVTEAYVFEPVSISGIVEESLKEFAPQLDTAGFTVNVEFPDDLPLVRADRQSMVLALGNLLDNAIRYSNVTRILSLAAHASRGAVTIDVTDAGTGIPENEIQQVTRKFFRGNDAISGGSGLGLSIAQRIVSDHSGSLSIKSQVGVGTTVSITIPTAPGDES